MKKIELLKSDISTDKIFTVATQMQLTGREQN